MRFLFASADSAGGRVIYFKAALCPLKGQTCYIHVRSRSNPQPLGYGNRLRGTVCQKLFSRNSKPGIACQEQRPLLLKLCATHCGSRVVCEELCDRHEDVRCNNVVVFTECSRYH